MGMSGLQRKKHELENQLQKNKQVLINQYLGLHFPQLEAIATNCKETPCWKS